MGGLVVCAFFALGVMTGFSTAGRTVALRASGSLNSYRAQILDSLAPARTAAASYSAVVVEWAGRAGLYRRGMQAPAASSAGDLRDGAIAIVERHDGFYQLFSGGELSGSVLDNARGAQMVDYAAVLVRAEAQLSEIISEMRVGDDGTASLFLERERTEGVIGLDRPKTELE